MGGPYRVGSDEIADLPDAGFKIRNQTLPGPTVDALVRPKSGLDEEFPLDRVELVIDLTSFFPDLLQGSRAALDAN